ncbi:MAG: recombinase family protein [Cellvibrionaceae bacterium]
MTRIGYVRTSKNKQYTDRQINELKNKCDKICVEDGVSARSKDRPVFRQVMAQLKAGDTLVVIAYDRAFRDVVEGLSSLDELTSIGVAFESITQRFDPTTPDGRLFYTITLAMAEWEVGNLALRTIHGLKAAVLRGSKLGRPRKVKKAKTEKRPKIRKAAS